MDCDIDTAIKERIFQLLRENPLTADYGKRIGFHVARGLYDFNANVD